MRPIAHFLHGEQVDILNMTAMNEERFIIVACLRIKIFKAEKILRDVVFSSTSFLNL